jgi:hypothetical protein
VLVRPRDTASERVVTSDAGDEPRLSARGVHAALQLYRSCTSCLPAAPWDFEVYETAFTRCCLTLFKSRTPAKPASVRHKRQFAGHNCEAGQGRALFCTTAPSISRPPDCVIVLGAISSFASVQRNVSCASRANDDLLTTLLYDDVAADL